MLYKNPGGLECFSLSHGAALGTIHSQIPLSAAGLTQAQCVKGTEEEEEENLFCYVKIARRKNIEHPLSSTAAGAAIEIYGVPPTI